jgi:tripartite-type tricarboxylate transporter receptor subunit TctC
VDLMGGHVISAVVALPVVAPHVKSGKVRGLAVTSGKRSSAIPEVPTLDESGLKGLDVSQWWGLLVPTGTQRDIVTKLQAELVELTKLPDMKARMAELGMEPVGSESDQFAALIRAEVAKYQKIAKQANIKID